MPVFYLAAQTNVVTQHNNLKRTGWNNTETVLTQANVSGGNFGEIFSRPVDDQIYAQPLVVSNLSISGGTHNVVIVATVNNTVYAFDADSAGVTSPYWQVNLTYSPGTYRTVRNTDLVNSAYGTICGGTYRDFSGNFGIVSTPVIDTLTNTIYLLARSVSQDGQTFVQYLHALDITTGNEKANSPVAITASVPGYGWQSNGTNIVPFDPQLGNQRPGLLLYNGTVYIAWASHCDWGLYHGWMMGYDASTLQQRYIYNSTPDGAAGGIWMSGQAPAVDDSGSIYISIGNGSTGSEGDTNSIRGRSESLVKLSAALQTQDFFTPMDYQYLNDQDLDYGSDGVMLIPNTNLSLSGSKESYLYMINNSNMGKTTTDNSNVVQLLNVNASSTNFDKHIHGSPVYFKDSIGNEYIYVWAETGLLKQFPFNRQTLLFDTLNKKVGNTVIPDGMPGAMLSVSSNAGHQGTGVVWTTHPIHGDANQGDVPGIVQAFDAADITHELWNTNMNGKRDGIGTFAKFVSPTVANGKLYMATFSKKLNVYGLNPPVSACQRSLPTPWESADIGYTANAGDACYNNGVYTITASGTGITGTADAYHTVYQLAGGNNVTVTARVVSIQNNNTLAEAGVMFRANLDPGSPNIFIGITAGDTAVFQNRTVQSGTTNSNNKGSFSIPCWVRITNTGNKYVGYLSADGNTWTAVDSITLALGANAYVSVAYSSADNTVLGTATVDHVSVVANNAISTNISAFTAKNINNKYAQLNWTTSSESNTSYFEIERSSGTTDFIPIDTVNASGNSSSAVQYTVNDNSPMGGVNYYRLKLVNNDGSFTYSVVVSVTFNFDIIDIFPNPASNVIYIRNNNNFSYGENLGIQLYDVLGKVLYTQTAASNGVDVIPVKIPASISRGVYVIMVTNSKGAKQARKFFLVR